VNRPGKQLAGPLSPLAIPAFTNGLDVARVKYLTMSLAVFQDNTNSTLQLVRSVEYLDSLKIQGYVWVAQETLFGSSSEM
jgi:hypothetical protein